MPVRTRRRRRGARFASLGPRAQTPRHEGKVVKLPLPINPGPIHFFREWFVPIRSRLPQRLEEDLRQHKEWGQAPYQVEDACSGAQHLPLRVPGRQTRSFRRYERQVVVVTLPIDCQCLPGAAYHPHRGLLYWEFSESIWLVAGPFVEPEPARSQQGPQLVRQASSFRNRVERGG
ncbi:hypothetical protein T09_11384 [Trichinella sp. T9]|nr:hypothetical protein T09_11384 [Trichinella sp. T9]